MVRYTRDWTTEDINETVKALQTVRDRLGYDHEHTTVAIDGPERYSETYRFRTVLDDIGEPAFGNIGSIEATVTDEATGHSIHFDYTAERDTECRLEFHGDEEERSYVEEYLGPEGLAESSSTG
ncbi:MAG: hypothetical protein SVU32_03500 [Candidatus Nanohaloarchaea archaeon]|nr:hypothetical protein [Candidatus Nanohaloarchaea archaeon]